MKVFFLAICLLSVCSFRIQAQNNTTSWHYLSRLQETEPLKDIKTIGLRDGNLLSFASLIGGKFSLFKSDTFGNLIWSKSYYYPQNDTIQIYFQRINLVEHPSGQIAVFLQTSYFESLCFFLLSATGTNQIAKRYNLQNSLNNSLRLANSIVHVDDNGNYNLFGGDFSTFSSVERTSAITLNQQGEFVKGKSFKLGNNLPDFSDAVPMKNGWLLSVSQLSTNPAFQNKNIEFIKLDKNFNIKKSIVQRKSKSFIRRTKLLNEDANSFHFTGTNYDTATLVPGSTPGSPFFYVFTQCLDSNLNVKWMKKFPKYEYQNIIFDYSSLDQFGVSSKKLMMVFEEGIVSLNSGSGSIDHFNFGPTVRSPSGIGDIAQGRNSIFLARKGFNPQLAPYTSYTMRRLRVEDTISDDKFCLNPAKPLVLENDTLVSENVIYTTINFELLVSTNIGLLSDSNFLICRYDGICMNYGYIFPLGACSFPFRPASPFKRNYYDERIIWAIGDTSYQPTFPTPGIYKYTLYTPCYRYTDSVRIEQITVTADLPDLTISACAKSTTRIQGNLFAPGSKYYTSLNNQVVLDSNFAVFTWDTTSTIRKGYVYYEYKDQRGCFSIDSQKVEILPLVPKALPDSILICPDEDTLLNSIRFYPPYFGIWTTPQDSTRFLEVLARPGGWYKLGLSIECFNGDSTFVGAKPTVDPGVQVFVNDSLYRQIPTSILFSDTVLLHLIPYFPQRARWYTANRTPIATLDGHLRMQITKDTVFEVRLSYDDNCGQEVVFKFEFVKEKGEPMFPNLITLNGDGKNETLTSLKFMPQNGNLSVFNRWGKRVFEKENYTGNWPDSDIESGTYFYYFEYESSGKKEVLKDWVALFK